jgi:hypothetical protein
VEFGLNKIIATFAQIIGNKVKMGQWVSEERTLKIRERLKPLEWKSTAYSSLAEFAQM